MADTAPRRRGFRIVTLLAVVVVVPLVGAAVLAVEQVGAARSLYTETRRVERDAGRAVRLAQLDAALGDEKNWSAVRSVVEALHAPPGRVEAALGADPTARLDEARRRVDALVGELGLTQLLPRLDEARDARSAPRRVVTAYDEAQLTLRTELEDALDRVSTSVEPLDPEVARAVETLGASIDLRRSTTSLIEGYYTTIFDIRSSPAVELRRLIAARAAFDRRADALEDLATSDTALERRVRATTASAPTFALLAAVDDLIGDSLRDGTPPAGRRIEMEVVAGNPQGFGAVFATSTSTQVDALEIVDRAGELVLAASSDVERRADRELMSVSALATVLVLLSLGGAAVGSTLIVRPLRRLQAAATALGAGDDLPPPAGGPVEVRAADAAIRDAGDHLALVTSQVHRLAAGELDAPVLVQSAPGGLGAAVQGAVGTLRDALAAQDDYRRRLAHDAAHDGLTGLPNRNASLQQLARALARTGRSGRTLAVLFIDLDGFKDVNDRHGHHAGDVVLSSVAERLVLAVREGDHVGRLGGDEFVVIAEPVSSAEEAVLLGHRLVSALDEPVVVGDLTVTVGASVGIALTERGDLSPDELLRDADLAVYRAKERERGSVEVCDEDLRTELAAAAELTSALRHALEHDELVLHYQPIVEPGPDGAARLAALEALVRWARPGHDGLVPPDRFIPHAERSMLIVEIDRWVVDAAARQIARWQADGSYDGTPIAINISRRHLASEDFVEDVVGPFRDRGIDLAHVIAEVTESALLDDPDVASGRLDELRSMGMTVAIDDFGTGFTSLAHLRTLPVDILKLDRSITVAATGDMHEASVAKLIIDTGHLLGARITAEGVETADEARTLTALGSDRLQGFLYARPLPPDEVVLGGVPLSTAARVDRYLPEACEPSPDLDDSTAATPADPPAETSAPSLH